MLLETSDLPLLLTRHDVARVLGVPLRLLTYLAWGMPASRRYTYFEISKRGGGPARPIHAPVKPLKDLQQRLASLLTRCYEPPPQVHGFVPERSPISNAARHRGQAWLLRIDMSDFFPSINFGRVRGMFMAFPFEYPTEVATLLAQVCCHGNSLPQGAPTSPVISNYICRGMDTALGRLAVDERCYYTRYADDVLFSTDRTVFPPALASVEGGVSVAGPLVREIIEDHGFHINDEKTRLMRRTQRQRATGYVVNEKVNVPRDYVRHLRNLLFIWAKYGEAAAEQAFHRAGWHANWPPGKPGPDFRRSIQGQVQHVGAIKGWNNPVYRTLAAALDSVDEDYLPRPEEPSGEGVHVYTEGESDALHLRAALGYFHALGDFLDLNLLINNESPRGGDAELKRHCEALSAVPLPHVSACIFDRDNPQILRKVLPDADADYALFDNGVVAIALVAPERATEDGRLCIEMLYDGLSDLQDDLGRRVFLAAEFDPRTGHHKEGPYTIPDAQRRTLVREEVHEFTTGESVGMTKMDFARRIASGALRPPDFEAFRPTFKVLEQAVAEAREQIARRDAA